MTAEDLLKPNILVDGHGHARVSDFGLASIAYGKYSAGLMSDKGRTARWSAPEVLFGFVSASKQADVFAFGMVVIEVRSVFCECGNARFLCSDCSGLLISHRSLRGMSPSPT